MVLHQKLSKNILFQSLQSIQDIKLISKIKINNNKDIFCFLIAISSITILQIISSDDCNTFVFIAIKASRVNPGSPSIKEYNFF